MVNEIFNKAIHAYVADEKKTPTNSGFLSLFLAKSYNGIIKYLCSPLIKPNIITN